MSRERIAQIRGQHLRDLSPSSPIELENDNSVNSEAGQMYELETTADVLLMTNQATPAIAPVSGETREEGLIRSALEGARDAFRELYDRYAPMVHGILLARVPSREVDDLVQDIFLHALKKLHTLRNHGAFGAWIAMIARNRAMDFHRRSRPTVEVTEDIRSTAARPPDAREILAHIRELPEAYRETLVLRLVEGMTGPEIALRTGLTAPSVRVNLHRGMKMLRTRLGLKENL